MFLDIRQKLIQTQKLIMTPQLQQAIKLLQLSRADLAETIRQELAKNSQKLLSEAGISKILNDEGIDIVCRMVLKYREKSGILLSIRRKRF